MSFKSILDECGHDKKNYISILKSIIFESTSSCSENEQRHMRFIKIYIYVLMHQSIHSIRGTSGSNDFSSIIASQNDLHRRIKLRVTATACSLTL